MKRYRIYTEARSNLPELVEKYFPGFSIFTGTGYWKRKTEYCAVIEIIADNESDRLMSELADEILSRNEQECVLVTADLTDVHNVM